MIIECALQDTLTYESRKRHGSDLKFQGLTLNISFIGSYSGISACQMVENSLFTIFPGLSSHKWAKINAICVSAENWKPDCRYVLTKIREILSPHGTIRTSREAGEDWGQKALNEKGFRDYCNMNHFTDEGLDEIAS